MRKAWRGRAATSPASPVSSCRYSASHSKYLKQIAPAVVRVALIYDPDNPNSVHYRRISEGASARLAIETVDHPIHGLADIDRAVASLADRGNSGIFFLPDITTNTLRDDVVALVARRRVPAIYSDSFS